MLKLLEVTFYFKLATSTALVHGLCNELMKIMDKMEKRFMKVLKDASSGSSGVSSNASSRYGSTQGSPRSAPKMNDALNQYTFTSQELSEKASKILSPNSKIDIGLSSPEKSKTERLSR